MKINWLKLKKELQNLQNIDFNDLNYKEIGLWPMPLRLFIFIIELIVIIILGNKFLITPLEIAISQKHQQQLNLRKEFSTKYSRTANLEEYRKQLEDIKEEFRIILLQLPKEDQVPELLESISQNANSARVTYDSIKPQGPQKLDFYTVYPIDIKVSGEFHDLGFFVSSIAELSRIVTLHDFNIELSFSEDALDGDTVNNNLKMDFLAKTYWYNQEFLL